MDYKTNAKFNRSVQQHLNQCPDEIKKTSSLHKLSRTGDAKKLINMSKHLADSMTKNSNDNHLIKNMFMSNENTDRVNLINNKRKQRSSMRHPNEIYSNDHITKVRKHRIHQMRKQQMEKTNISCQTQKHDHHLLANVTMLSIQKT